MVASAEYDPVIVEVPLTSQRVTELLDLGARKRESAKLDFKMAYNPSTTQDKVELTKDLVAMANTAGGYIVVGVEDGGTLRGLSDAEIALLDEAKIRGQVQSYLGTSLELFVEVPESGGKRFGVITVLRSPRSPLVFQKDGQYVTDAKKEVTAFRAGDVFVRHGSSSERWNQSDVQTIYARVVERERERWLRETLPDLRRAFSAVIPEGADAVPSMDAGALVLQDAETFEQTIRNVVRRLQ